MSDDSPSVPRETALLALAERCEQATADEQEAILREAYRAIYPEPDNWNPGTPEGRAWGNRTVRFVMMLGADAFESAAMMLVPEGETVLIEFDGERYFASVGDVHVYQVPGGYALALTAAALRAHAATLNPQDHQG